MLNGGASDASTPRGDDFERFRGVVTRETPGVGAGSVVEIERERDGWHLYVTPGAGVRTLTGCAPNQRGAAARDVWCDGWSDAEHWFREWQVVWQVCET